MNARNYRVKIIPSQLDFPAISGLGRQSDYTQTEVPVLSNNKVVLKTTKTLTITDEFSDKEYEVMKIQSIYEIPVNAIKTQEDVYEVYKDATLTLSEAYKYVQRHMPLPNLPFPMQPMEMYGREIDGVMHLINSRN